MNLKSYRQHVLRASQERNGDTIYNGSADHAGVIIEHLFLSARSHARLLTGDLNARVYGLEKVVQRAKQFLGHSDHKLELLLEQKTYSRSHPLIEAIGKHKNVEARLLPNDVSERLSFHLMTADDDCFRFEREKDSHAAVAAFGDNGTTEHLNSVFDELFEASEPFDLISVDA